MSRRNGFCGLAADLVMQLACQRIADLRRDGGCLRIEGDPRFASD